MTIVSTFPHFTKKTMIYNILQIDGQKDNVLLQNKLPGRGTKSVCTTSLDAIVIQWFCLKIIKPVVKAKKAEDGEGKGSLAFMTN